MLVRVDDGQGWTAEQSYELAWINAAPGSLSGTVFDDADADGVQDAGEPPLVGWTVYLDENQNGKLESGERTAVTNASGQYSFTGVPIGDYTVGIVKQPDWALFAPVNRVHTGALSGGQAISGLDFSLVSRGAGNSWPVFQSDPITAAVVGNTYRYRPAAFDADGDELTFSLAYGPRGMTIDPATGTLAWTPPENENSYVDVTLRVDDGQGGFAFQPFQIFLSFAENHAPIFTSEQQGSAAVGVPWSYHASAVDPDGDTVTYSLDAASLDRGLTINPASGAIHWTPTSIGDYVVTITAVDDRGGSGSQVFNLPVGNNTPPQFDSAPPIPGIVGELYTYHIDVSDGDGDSLTLSLDSASTTRGMTLSGDATTGYTLTWTPSAEGDFPVTLSLGDGESSVTQVFKLPVIAPVVESLPPEITSKPQGPIYAASLSAWTYTILANDPDGDDGALTYSLELPTSNSEVSLTGNVLSWHPANPGSETFRILVTDEDEQSTSQSFTATALSSRVGVLPEITSVPTGPAVRGTTYQYQVVAFDPNGDPLSYALAEPVAGASIDAQTGLLSFTPGVASSANFEIEVSDGIDGTRTQSFTLDVVSPPGTLPRITSSPVGPAISGQAWNYTVAAIDTQGDAITYALVSATSSNGTETVSFNSSTRTVAWTPTAAALEITVTVSASDVDGTTLQTFTLGSVAPPSTGGGNEPPVFASQPQGPVLVGQLWSYVARATDADGDTLTYSLDAGSISAGLSIDSATGRIEWTPTSTGNFPISVTADDGNGGAVTQSFTATVSRSNAAPKITSKPSGPAVVGSPWSYTLAATDANDPVGSLIYELVSPSPSGEIDFSAITRTLTWTAASASSQAFELKVTDPHGASVTESFTIHAVAPGASNTAPTFVSAPTTSVRMGESYRDVARAVDADGDPVTYSLSAAPVGMSIHPTSGVISWNPSSIGTFAVTIAADDGVNTASTRSFSVIVTAPVSTNHAPQITSNATGPASRNLAWSYPVEATDPDGDTLVYTIDTSEIPSGAIGDLAINSSTGLITWTPTSSGSFVIGVHATDPSGASDGRQFTLPVLDNAPPRFTTQPSTSAIEIGSPYSYAAEAVDPNPGDTVSYALDQASLDRGLTINTSTGLVEWAAGSTTTAGVYPVTITASDSQGATATQGFDIRVFDSSVPNSPPLIAAAPNATLQIGQKFVRDLLATDPDGDSLTFSLSGAPAGLTVSTSGILQWTPATPGIFTFTASASDGQATTSQEFTLTVGSQAANTAPRITTEPNKSALAGAIYRYDVDASDADGDTLIYSLTKKTAGMQINYSTGLIQWIPTESQIGEHEVTVSVSDLRGGVDNQTLKINVGNVNRPPVIDSHGPAQAVVGQPYAYPIRATDPDGHALTFSIDAGVTTADTNGVFNIDSVTGLVTWIPETSGTYRIQINVIDEFGLGTGEVFDVDVLSSLPNHPPRFTSAVPPLEIAVGEIYTHDFDAMDPDDDALTFSLPEKPAGASINASTGVVTWDTTGVTVGTLAAFKVVVSDGTDAATYRYSVRVQPANVAPYFNPAPANPTLVAGQTMRLDVKAYDANAGDAITYSLDPASTALGMTIDSYGRITWATDASDITSTAHPVTVTISDGRLSDDATFNVSVEEDTAGPTIQLIASKDNLAAGDFVDLRVHALDNVAVTERTLTLVSVTKGGVTTTLNQSLALNAAGQARLDILASHMGTLLFEATAKDAAGNSAVPKQVSLVVIDPSDTNPPTVDLLPPTTSLPSPSGRGAGGEGNTVLAPTDLLGVIDDDLPSGVSWTLTLAPADSAMGEWSRQIASGTGLVTTATALGQFDPTMLAGGSYRLTLSATDAGGHTSSDSEIVNVDGRLKLGNFALSFTDLEIPVAGIPITIRRTYDTLNAGVIGDFGYGWKLDVVQPTISVDLSTTGRYPARINGRSYPSFVDGTRVTVTTPAGTEESFTFKWQEVGFGYWNNTNTFKPTFIPDSGNQYELTPPGAGEQFNQFYMSSDSNDYSAMANWYGNFQLNEIGRGTRGLAYTIEPETQTGNGVQDKYGNKLRFDTDQNGKVFAIRSVVVDSSGNETDRGRTVTFNRDWLGRITSITDPANHSLTYKYDSAGRLTGFYDRRATERLTDSDPLNDYQPTKFQYTLDNNPAFENIPSVENYLTKIVDPLGTTAVQANYDSVTGRLISLVDADGNPASLDYDIDSLKVTSTSSSGTTEVTLDPSGNPIRSVDEQGNITLTQYADPKKGLPSKITQVVGLPDTPAQIAAGTGDDLTTSYTYNQWGQKTSETDPRGSKTITVYDSQGYPAQEIGIFGNTTNYTFWDGQLTGTSDADGNSTEFQYDTFGNVTGVTQSNGGVGTSTSTSFVYNTYGDLTSTTDADGNVRTITYDNLGRQIGTSYVWQDPLGLLPDQALTTSVNIGPDGNVDSSTDASGQTSTTLYDALGRAYIQIDANGRQSQTIYDKRGLAIETRTESPDENGNAVTLVSRTVYDESGRAIYTTGSFPADTAPSEITGTHTIYAADGRVEKTEQLLGIDVQLVGQASSLSSVLASAGTVVSFSSSIYNDAGRVVETFSDTGLRSQTLYGQFGEVVESRSEVPPATGESEGHWMVSRTIYDSFGRSFLSTDRFLVPLDTPLGEDPATGPVPTQVTKTIYDSRGRTTATERYTNSLVSPRPFGGEGPGVRGWSEFELTSPGTLESISETLYDSAGRVWRTVSGRVPLSTLSGVALSQAEALENYPAHGTAIDPYQALNLSPGVITDTLFDARGRQYASLGHPLPAADVGLSGTNYDGKLVRLRTETIYDSLGQASIQRSGLAQVESTTGTLLGVYDVDSVDTKTYSDAFGNVYRTEYITGGTVGVQPSGATTRTGGLVDSYTLTHFDEENRPVAEMQAIPGFVNASYNTVEQTFEVDSVDSPTGSPYAAFAPNYTVGLAIPTKLFIYDADDRLVAVELPAVPDPDNSVALTRPRYEYGYNAQGNQTLIRDPLGRETRFTFSAQGQQVTRTLPLGFGSDGIASAADLASLLSDPSDLSFTERTTFDTRGRQHLHTSFEGVISENIYDSFGRLDYINYYADQTAFDNGTISERWSYEYDSHGRKSAAIHSANNGGVLTPDRIEETFYDNRGRVIAESVPEGVLGYTYDSQSRLASTAVFAAGDDPFVDAPERITSYGYDILGRLASVTEDSTPTNTSDEPQSETDYGFNLQGRQRLIHTLTGNNTVPMPSLLTVMQYDHLGRLDTLTDYSVDPQDSSLTTQASYAYTVRADGKRTALEETHWLDADGDGVVDVGEQKTTTYDWTYDNVGRLTDEAIDHWDDTFDQTESFTFDLTGNRLQLDRDHGNDGVDQVITYEYDSNDRLLEEVLDDLVNNANDTTTSYGYDHTQQTSKTVATTSTLATRSSQLFTFNLQGRIATVINEGYTDGTLSSRERTSYEYNSGSYRVALVNEVDSALNNTYTLTSSTEFLADSRNHTGYVQTIRETTVNADGTSKTVDYTFGHDEIAQRTVERNSGGTITSDETLVFGHDGHGSVRVLFDLAETTASIIDQVATYAAYGAMLAVHNAVGALVGTSESAFESNLGYSGEQWDASLRMQNLRARPYDPRNGRFIGIDPFAGNMQDPQSLHKYAYVHGDPIGNIDPSGLFSAASSMAGSTIGAQLNSMQGESSLKVLESVTAVAAGASAGQALFAVLIVDVLTLGLPIAGKALTKFATKFTSNVAKFSRKLPIISVGGSHRIIMPGVGTLKKIDQHLDEAFDASRSLNAGNSQTLRKRLEDANGLPRDTLAKRGIQAHHVVPAEMAGVRNPHSLLDELDFNIDSALNGIPLDNTYHRSHHRNYNRAWRDVLDKIQASPQTKAHKQELLVEAIANANVAILDGPGLRSTNQWVPPEKWVNDILPKSLR